MTGPIEIAYVADVGDLVRGNDLAQASIRDTGSSFRTAGRVIGAGVALATTAVVAFGVKSVAAGSDAQQSIGATRTVFGRFSDDVIRRSNRAADAVGLSANSYRELANVLGASLNAAGIPIRQTEELTGRLVTRAADLAATFGGPTSEAVEAIGSLMRGEADPIERYGISIKESDVSARLAAKGLDELEGSALKAAQQQARLELLFRQSAKSAGTFGRESDTLAGQQQRWTAGIENLEAKVGKALLPTLTDLVSFGNREVLPWLNDLARDYLPVLTDALSDPDGKLDDLRESLGGVDWQDFGDNVGKVADLVGDLFTQLGDEGFETFNDGLSVTSEVLGFAADHVDVLEAALPYLAAGFVAVKGAQVLNNAVGRDSLIGFGLQLTATRQLTIANRELAAAVDGVNLAQGRTVSTVGTVTSKWKGLGVLMAGTVAAQGLGAITEEGTNADKAVGVLGDTLTGAFAGATIGSVIPGVGTAIGGIAGGAIGAAHGLYKLTDATDDAGPSAELASAAAEEYAGQLEAIAAASGKARRAEIQRLLQTEGDVIPAAERLGISQRSLIAILDGNANAYGKFNRQLAHNGDLVKGIDYQTVHDYLVEHVGDIRNADRAYDENADALKKWHGRLRTETSGAARDANRELAGIGKAKPSDAWGRYFAGDLEAGRGTARRGSDAIGGELRNGSSSWRANLNPFAATLSGDLSRLKSSAGGQGKSVGSAIGSGLEQGIGSWVGEVATAAANLVDGAIRAAKQAADSHSPSRKTIALGRDIGRGLDIGLDRSRSSARAHGDKLVREALAGMADGRRGVNSYLEDQLDQLANRYQRETGEELKRAQRQSIAHALEDERAALVKLSRDYRPLLRDLEAARGKLRQLIDARRDYAHAVRDAALETANVTQLGTLEDGTQTSDGIIGDLRDRLDAIRAFNVRVQQLREAGLNRATLRQIIDAGVDAGSVTADALLAGGDAAIDTVNQLEDRIGRAAGQLGDRAGGYMYDAGVKSARELVRGLEKDKRTLDRAAERIADRIAATVRRRFAHAVAAQEHREKLDADVATHGRRRVDTDAAERGQRRRITVTLNAEQTSAVQRGRAIRLDLDAYETAGGRK